MLNLPPPHAKQLSRFNRDRQSVISAMAIAATLRKFTDVLRPATVAAIAQSLSPGLPIKNALAALTIQVDDALADTIAFNAAAKGAEATENARIKPSYDRAGRRFFELMNAMPGLKQRVESERKDHAAKIRKLIEAGLSADEATRFAGKPDVAVAVAALESASSEHAALDLFLKTKDEQDLPSGFITFEAI